MQLMITDETNKTPSYDAKFFAYGGLIFPIDHLHIIHEQMEIIRRDMGYKPGDELKFDSHSRPENVSFEKFTEAKKRVIDLCISLGCKFIVHIILHDIIKKQDPDEQVTKAADYVIGRFNKYLNEEVNDDGICIVDNLPNNTEFKYLIRKFSYGLEFYDGNNIRLDRIKLFASTRIGASHANSAMDIVLGCFRYAINNPKNVDAARDMLNNVSQMMWALEKGDTRYVRDRGLIIRPPLEGIRNKKYRLEYDQLINHLTNLGNNKND